MMRRFRQVITALKEHSQVSYAKIATLSGFCDVELIIIKATAPNDLPLPEHYIHELLKIFNISPSSFRAFSLSFTRRFAELGAGVLLSNVSLSFTDCSGYSSFASQDYIAFIRSYAQLLDEALNCFVLDSNAKDYYLEEEENEEQVPETLAEKMKEVGRKLEILPQLQSLIDRVMDCRPIGLVKN
ncbi:putative clathrin assembly protein At2g25430 [Fagus crenata]